VNYPPIIQAVVILKAARDKDTSEKFLKFLKQPSTVALMQQYGFVPPSEGATGQTNSGGAN
jgi:ABC-type molybdate transport system substrate-binding protein